MPIRHEMLRCTACKGVLVQSNTHHHCSPCNVDYPIVDGIPDMIPCDMDKHIKKMTETWFNLSWDYDSFIAQTMPERLQAIDVPLQMQ